MLVHKWTQMGAVAPYKFIGFEKAEFQAHSDAPVQAGATCDYCGTGIMNVFKIEDSTGKSFKLGCECIKALNDKKLTYETDIVISQQNRVKRIEKEHNLRARLEPEYLKALEILATKPHPNTYFASQGKTAKDYITYFPKNSKWMKTAIKLSGSI